MAGRPTFVKSEDTRILEHKLQETPEGSTCTYEDLSKSIGRDVRVHAMGSLRSALNSLERGGLVFACIANEGYVRLDPQGIVKSTGSGLTRAQRAARKHRRRLETVDISRLDGETRREMMNKSAQLGAVELFSSKRASQKIAALPDTSRSAGRISMQATLDLMGGSNASAAKDTQGVEG